MAYAAFVRFHHGLPFVGFAYLNNSKNTGRGHAYVGYGANDACNPAIGDDIPNR